MTTRFDPYACGKCGHDLDVHEQSRACCFSDDGDELHCGCEGHFEKPDLPPLHHEYDHVLDWLRYVTAQVLDTLQFRAIRIAGAIERGDHHPGLLEAVLEDVAEIKRELTAALAACVDDPLVYSDGTSVIASISTDETWGLVLDIAEPPVHKATTGTEPVAEKGTPQ